MAMAVDEGRGKRAATSLDRQRRHHAGLPRTQERLLAATQRGKEACVQRKRRGPLAQAAYMRPVSSRISSTTTSRPNTPLGA